MLVLGDGVLLLQLITAWREGHYARDKPDWRVLQMLGKRLADGCAAGGAG